MMRFGCVANVCQSAIKSFLPPYYTSPDVFGFHRNVCGIYDLSVRILSKYKFGDLKELP